MFYRWWVEKQEQQFATKSLSLTRSNGSTIFCTHKKNSLHIQKPLEKNNVDGIFFSLDELRKLVDLQQ